MSKVSFTVSYLFKRKAAAVQHNRLNYYLLSIVILCTSLTTGCGDDTEVITPLNASKVKLPDIAFVKLSLPDSITTTSLETPPEKLSKAKSKPKRQSKIASRATFDPYSGPFNNLGIPRQGNTSTSMQLMFGTTGGIGTASSAENDCPLWGPEEPRTTTGSSGGIGICVERAVKNAIKRVSADYSNATSIIYAVGQQLGDVPQNQLIEYRNPDVETDAEKGVTIQFKYYCTQNCTSSDETQKSYKHILGLTPLSDRTKMIGRMEWDVLGDGSANGKIIIDKGLMKGSIGWTCTNGGQPCGGPTQIEYTFESDANGQARSYTMKYLSDSTDEFRHEATLVRMQRQAANSTTGTPAVWIVQGVVPYAIGFPINPAQDMTYHSVPFASVNLHFNAVAEDIAQGGKAIYNAVFANDAQQLLPRSSAITANDLNTAHLWAMYKNFLKANYTKEFYSSWQSSIGIMTFPVAPDAPIGNAATITANRTKADINANANDFSISVDGKRIAAAGRDGFLKIYDIDPWSTNAYATPLLPNCSPHGGAALTSVRFSADGTEVLTTGADRVARRINVSNCSTVASFALPASNCTNSIMAEYGNDGNIYTGGPLQDDALVQQWSHTGTLLKQKAYRHYGIAAGTDTPNPFSPLCPSVNNIQLSPDQRMLLTSHNDTTARVWYLSDDNELILKHLSQQTINGIVTPINSGFYAADVFAIFNPDATEVVSSVAFGDWEQVGLFRWSTNNPGIARAINTTYLYKEFNYSSGGAIRFSPDNNYLFTGYGGAYRVNNKTATPVGPAFSYIRGGYENGSANNVSVLPNSNNRVGFYTKNNYGGTGTIYGRGLLESSTPWQLPFAGSLSPILKVHFSKDGKRIASGSDDGSVFVWSANTGSALTRMSGHGASPINATTTNIRSARFVDNDTKVLSAGADRAIRVWNAETGQLVWQYTVFASDVNSADANNNFSLIAVATSDGVTSLFGPTGNLLGTLPALNVHTGSANTVAFLPTDPNILAESGADGVLNIWNVQNPAAAALVQTQLVTDPANPGRSVAIRGLKYSNDGGRLVATSVGLLAYIFDGRVPQMTPSTPLSITELTPAINDAFFPLFEATPNPLPNDTRVLTTRNYVRQGNTVYSNSIDSWDSSLAGTRTNRMRVSYFDGYYAQSSNSVYGTDYNPDGSVIAAGYAGGRYSPSWIDFDGFWQQNQSLSNATQGLWADVGTAVNPYYIYPTVTSDPALCYEVDAVSKTAGTPSCKTTCAQTPGGCYYQSSISTYRATALTQESQQLGTPDRNPIVNLDYALLRNLLSTLDNNWYNASYTNVTIPPVQ